MSRTAHCCQRHPERRSERILRRSAGGRTAHSVSTPSEATDASNGATRPVEGDAALIDAARRGDRAAFGRLYDRHAATTYRYVLSIVRETSDAEDVVQDVFITTWARIGDIRIVDTSALPWLLTAARFTALNHLRATTRARRRTEEGDLSGHAVRRDPTEEEVTRRLLFAAIEEAVAGLSDTDQALYYLCIEQGSSYADAAEALGASHGAVRNRLSRLRGTLRTALRPFEREF
ncbi:RNA polymerase sigma factor [Rathayibacter oskolensis]|uniref:RNA polymerase sigma factor n=1 Tax=Rathayibacter oskolensis TaxID=1891671 RepID=UPI00265D9801|nr:RNA polymerase sigma factor [Rathayibacter oskolensis]WKK72744.1 RNA polymerase sigma factor [Rathayibacter oskolensis]